jgi:hypothetical protein
VKRARAHTLAVALTALTLVSGSALACSPAPDYKGPGTNFELVQEADTIFVGSLVRSLGKDWLDRKLLVKPTYLLKGPTLPKEVSIRGFLSDETIQLPDKSIRVRATKSSELDLWRPNPEVWIGGCSRQTFNRGMQVVLFFKQDAGQLRWLDPAFARSSEDVAGPNNLWVRAVKLYAQIGQLPLAEQKAALRTEMLKLRKDRFLKSENTLLADDIERQLAGVGPVSHFYIERSTADERRWIENIVNESYRGQVAIPIDVMSPPKPRSSWNPLWVLGGIFFVVGGIVIATILRNRARKTA